MEIIIGTTLLLLLILGLLARRRQKRRWVAEERYDESGTWIDKRAGERGTWGRLDEERAHERKNINLQGRAGELTRLIRAFAFEEYPGFHERPDAFIQNFNLEARAQAARLITAADQLLNGILPANPSVSGISGSPYSTGMKKQILDFLFNEFPGLLNLELEKIKQLDGFVEMVAKELVNKMQ